MKIQDIVFGLMVIILLIFYKRRVAVSAGLLCYLIAIPLYIRWIFFSAERLVIYGSLLLLLSFLIPKSLKNAIK